MGTAVPRLRALLARAQRRQVHVRPTREGLVFGLMLLGVVVAAVNTGNNLLYLVLGALCALLVLSAGLAEWNLRSVRVWRRLPAEAWAERAAGGAFVVENRRRLGAAWGLRLAEVDAEGAVLAQARVARVGPGVTLEVPARWTFAARGIERLESVRVESHFPFGLVRRWRDLPAAGELLVWPSPLGGPLARRSAGAGLARPDRRRRGREGDFQGLRPYVAGDPLRDLHWPTSARTGRPMVVVRDAAQADEVVVEVVEVTGEAWERELSRAAGQLQRHFAAGHAVGLRFGGAVHAPRTGDPWRRRLLALLALAPVRAARSA